MSTGLIGARGVELSSHAAGQVHCSKCSVIVSISTVEKIWPEKQIRDSHGYAENRVRNCSFFEGPATPTPLLYARRRDVRATWTHSICCWRQMILTTNYLISLVSVSGYPVLGKHMGRSRGRRQLLGRYTINLSATIWPHDHPLERHLHA